MTVHPVNQKHVEIPLWRDIPISAKDWHYVMVERPRKEITLGREKATDFGTPSNHSASEVEDERVAHLDKMDDELSTLDTHNDGDGAAKYGKWESYWAVITTGAGLFSDGYVNNTMSTVSTCLATLYGDSYTKSRAIQNLSSIVFAGTVVGQLSFGVLSDQYSRKKSMLIGTGGLILFTILCSGAWGHGTHNKGKAGGLFAALTAYRFFLGIAIGSEYSSGSPAAAEAANCLPKRKRNRWFIWFTNLAIDSGFIVGAFVPLVLLWICGERHLTPVWRISIGLGAIPPVSLFFLRLKYRETSQFEKGKKLNKSVPLLHFIKFYWFRLGIVSVIWFLYDFSAYAFGTYSSIIIGEILPKDAKLYRNFGWNVVFNLFYFPGSFIGAYFTDWFGPRNTMVVGLVLQSAIGYGLAGGLHHLRKHIGGFVVVYGIFMTLGEFAAGNNVGLIASKTGSTPIRESVYGIAAMIGKVGAFVGSYIFPVIIRRHGLPAPYWVSSSLCLFSALLSYLFLPELDQDSMNLEDAKFLEYLESVGFDTSMLDLKRDVQGTTKVEEIKPE
ncbi:Git1p KNAG_0E01100 [Huiozyma naganishii CBS 8797]|uniref:Major facilitator superfamily (MFS) profile domain-containing protein n=1 Tax=Huiozyma naganishii (strain ATCC MYA-139 / BCRC 22969 / CBS 8797 / KCTC 17520 / NBRC 10181 / NCYC 3082 / Yp74L-3) TaxID=1071383 RepID=J7RYW1_HUIN7|nr:hypothetical protein KNAG_0E01100 [Kazachstania naganishii CBS 8797]CCK70377.1 hypothetical protein KNAG_0E01100 [Kazachstania naganishii CBS 8797]